MRVAHVPPILGPDIAEQVLQYVYPIDLLELSRTNSHLRKTLVDPEQRHIWKSARKRFPHLTIPDPVVLTEIAVASLLFETGICSVGYSSLHWIAWAKPLLDL
jgi:hypothetical protein